MFIVGVIFQRKSKTKYSEKQFFGAAFLLLKTRDTIQVKQEHYRYIGTIDLLYCDCVDIRV